MGECDTEKYTEQYIVVTNGLELLAFGPSIGENNFSKHATELKKRELETAKHAVHYKGEDTKIIFYQDLRTGKYDFTSTKSKEDKAVYHGGLDDVISFIEKCKGKLDSEKIAYENAIKTLKNSNKK